METITKMFRSLKNVLKGYTLEDEKVVYLEEGLLPTYVEPKENTSGPTFRVSINEYSSFVENGTKLFISTYGLIEVLNRMYVNKSQHEMYLPY